MNAIPTATNGGLILYLAIALVLAFAAATYRPRTQTDPDASIRQDRRAGAITTTSNKKEVVMSDSTDPTAKIRTAAAPHKPWWVCPASAEPQKGWAEEIRSGVGGHEETATAWLRWRSAPIGDGVLDCWLERFVDLDDGPDVLAVHDSIVLDNDGLRIDFPEANAEDVVALIRAARSIAAAHLNPMAGEGQR